MDWAFFAVNGLNFCGIFEEKKLSFGFRDKKKGKTVKRLVKLWNLEKNE